MIDLIPVQYRVAVIAVGIVILVALSAGAGVWLAAGHYRPMLDTAQTDLATAKTVNGNLLALTTEQGLALGRMVAAGEERKQKAEQAVDNAKADAAPDYAAANTIQREHTGGDPATAAASIIDKELGL